MQHPIFNDSNKFCDWLVDELGPQFKKYVNQFIDDGVNAELISSLDQDEWSGLITDPNHRRALTHAVVDMMDFGVPGIQMEPLCPKEHIIMAARQLDVEDIVTWLQMIGSEFEQYGQVFLDNGVDGALLYELAPEDLAELVPDAIHRSALMDEIADPSLRFLSAILRQKPGCRPGVGSYQRRRSVVVPGGAILNDTDHYKNQKVDEVSKYFDSLLEISDKNDNLLPWLTVNGFASYHLTLTSKGCTWETFESIDSPQYLVDLGISPVEAESIFQRIQETRAGAEAEMDSPGRSSGIGRCRSQQTGSIECESISDRSEIEEISPLKIDWMVFAITKYLQPDNVACDFLSKLWSLGNNSSNAESERRRLIYDYQTEVRNTIIQKTQDLIREHKENLLRVKDEFTSLARLAFSLDATVPSIFAEVPGSMYTLPRQLVLELFDFGIDCDTNGFPLWFSSEEDRGTLFHAFLCGIVASGDQLNFHTLRAIAPHIDVHTHRGSSALDIVATGLHHQDSTKAEVCSNLYMQLQQYGFLRTSLSSTSKENDLHGLYQAIEKETCSAVISCNFLKMEVRTLIVEFLIGFKL